MDIKIVRAEEFNPSLTSEQIVQIQEVINEAIRQDRKNCEERNLNG